MKSKIIWLILSCLLVLSMVLTSCGTKTTPTTTLTTTSTTTTKPSTTPTTTPTTVATTAAGNWWEKQGEPQYGGTLTMRMSGDPAGWDNYTRRSPSADIYQERLGQTNRTLDPKINDFGTRFRPVEHMAGLYAESWEQPDLQTVIFHIRKGITWWDKYPANGRELIADDIAFHYNREYGLGGYGFSKRSPYMTDTQFDPLLSVTATDKYTVVAKTKTPNKDMLATMLDIYVTNNIECPDSVKLYGDLNDWKNAMGTGPFILKDYVSGSSIIYEKNTKYWGYDERYPENRLPYADMLKFLIITDNATAMAAVRTGKISIIENMNWQQAGDLKKTNPELLLTRRLADMNDLDFRVDSKPFTDIRVRKAMQMAIDFPTIAKSYYGGNADPTPYGLVSSVLIGYYTPFDQWPADVKAGYTYDPAGAKKLLAEAGFPNGFKTNVVMPSSGYDIDLVQVAKAYFTDIGVDMEIKLMDLATATMFITNKKEDQMCFFNTAGTMSRYPDRILTRRYSTGQTNYGNVNDPTYDAMVDKFMASSDLNERREITKKANDYALSQFWGVQFPVYYGYAVSQPSLMGFRSEIWKTTKDYGGYWINQKLK
jgi:peptide/nickel transport system substrate-binding protein